MTRTAALDSPLLPGTRPARQCGCTDLHRGKGGRQYSPESLRYVRTSRGRPISRFLGTGPPRPAERAAGARPGAAVGGPSISKRHLLPDRRPCFIVQQPQISRCTPGEPLRPCVSLVDLARLAAVPVTPPAEISTGKPAQMSARGVEASDGSFLRVSPGRLPRARGSVGELIEFAEQMEGSKQLVRQVGAPDRGDVGWAAGGSGHAARHASRRGRR